MKYVLQKDVSLQLGVSIMEAVYQHQAAWINGVFARVGEYGNVQFHGDGVATLSLTAETDSPINLAEPLVELTVGNVTETFPVESMSF